MVRPAEVKAHDDGMVVKRVEFCRGRWAKIWNWSEMEMKGARGLSV